MKKFLEKSYAIIYGCEGLHLSPSEKDFFKDAQPLGFILFARNIDNVDQLTNLINELRAVVGWDCPILIDQEGGKVERLKPPHWLSHVPAKTLGDLYHQNSEQGIKATKLHTLSMAKMLSDLNITVNCAPVLDVPIQNAHDVIGNRAYSNDTTTITTLGRVVAETYVESGITPVIKHIPGHGRALSDSHEELPIVDTDIETLRRTDFIPFHALSTPIKQTLTCTCWGMTAHVLYKSIDTELPATLSHNVIQSIIRSDDNPKHNDKLDDDMTSEQIGFDGFLVGDDVFMKALDKYGDLNARVRMSLEAGIDAALFCHGNVKDMELGLKGSNTLRKNSINRFIAAEESRVKNKNFFETFDIKQAREELSALLKQ